MQRWIKAVATSMLMALGVAVPAAAQTTLVGGGLTSRPTPIYTNVLANGGFETVSGGVPTSWSPSGTWKVDQLVKHTGSFSYSLSSGGAQATQTLQLQPGVYRLSGWIKTQSSGSGSARLTLDFRPAINAWSPSPDLAGTNDWTYQEVLVTVPDARSASVVLDGFYANGGFQAWYDDVKLELQQASPVGVFMLYPNFRGMLFDDQSQTMKFAVTVAPPSGDVTQYTVKAGLTAETSGTLISTKTFPASASFTADVDGSVMQAGQGYLVTFSLVNASGGTVYSYPAYRVSKVPGSAKATMNVAVDDKNRVLVHGRPRFVLGVYDSGLGYSADPTFWENTLWSATGDRRMNGLNINFYLNYWYGQAGADAMNALMTNLQNHGVMYLQTGNCFDKYPADGSFLINSSDSYVQTLGSHPGSAGFYTIDECISALVPGAFTQYDRLRRLNPASVTFMANFGNPDLTMWRDAMDVPSTDPYPMYGAEPAGGYDFSEVAQWTQTARTTFMNSRPIMTVLQFFQFTSQGRWPTRQEMRNMAYMAITEGAHGLWWWSLGDNALSAVCSGWCAEKSGHMDDLKAVVAEISALEQPLLADDAPGALTGNSSSAIKTKVKVLNGTGYVFAYNSTNAAATATLTWNTAPGTITVNGESRTLSASGNSFTDSFGPFQAHVYVLANGGSGGTTSGGTGGTTTGGSGGTTTGGGGTTTGGSTGGTPTSAPTVTFTNPPATTTSVGGSVTVTMAASGGSGTGYTYQLAVDGTSAYNGTNGTFSWNSASVANGSHTLTAKVTDSANQTGTATRTLTVSNTTPTTAPPPPTAGTLKVYVTQPTANATVSGTNWVVMWLGGSTGSSNTYTLSVGGRTVGSTTTSSTGPVSVPWSTTAVADGTQVLTASARDASGNTGSTSVSLTVKNGTTTTPALVAGFAGPAGGSTVSGTVNVTLTASGGSGSGYTYKLAVDGGTPISLTGASYSWNTGSVTNGSHTLAATVIDSGGHTATASRTVTVSNTTVTPLTITFTAPTANATVSGTTPISASAAGGTGLSYKLAVDGTQVATAASLSWNTTTATNGSHTLTASVTDALNRTATTTRTVTVSNAATTPAPTGTLSVAVTQPTNGTTVNGTNWAVAWVSGAASGTATYTLSAGGKTVGTATSTPVGPVSVPWNTALVADGTQTLTMSVRDSAGNTGSASVSVTVKNNTATTVVPTAAVTTTLQVGVTQPTAGSTVNGTNWAVVWVTGAAAGNATYTLTAGGKTVGSTSASPTGAVSVAWDTTLVADGSQTLTVSVRDSAGNAGSTSVSVNVKNSTTPTGTLSVAITQPTNSATVSGTAWVVMWAGGTSGTSNTFTLAVDGQTVATQTGASAGPVTLPWTTSSSGNGTHTVTATVSDATGNTGTNTISVTVAN